MLWGFVHIAQLRKRAAEAEAKLKRLYDAIENGVADLSDPMLKDRIAELTAVRDQADRTGPAITPQALKTFARQARRRMRTETAATAAITCAHLPNASKWT
jgi:site-specific DNA recombinase